MTADAQLTQVRLSNFFTQLRAAGALTPVGFAHAFTENLLFTVAEQVPASARPAWRQAIKRIVGEQRSLTDDELSKSDIAGLAKLPMDRVKAVVASLDMVQQALEHDERAEHLSQLRNSHS